MEQELKSINPKTLANARKNTRSILHITVGIPGEWEPTREELAEVERMFTTALEDPVGAVVATRTGIYPAFHTTDEEGDIEVIAVAVTQPVPPAADPTPEQ
jgi:hypothetical protein